MLIFLHFVILLCSFLLLCYLFFFFFNDTATTEIYTLSLHDALPISQVSGETSALKNWVNRPCLSALVQVTLRRRSEEHTSELQSHSDLVCRLLLEKKKKKNKKQKKH